MIRAHEKSKNLPACKIIGLSAGNLIYIFFFTKMEMQKLKMLV